MQLRRSSLRRALVLQGVALGALVIAAACSNNNSNVVGNDDGGGTGSSGAGSSGTGSSGTGSSGTGSSGQAGSSGTGSSGTGSSGTGSSGTGSSGTGIGGSSGGTDAGLVVEAGSDGGCPPETTVTEATKITFTVGWPSSTAGNAGTGAVNIWLLTKFTTVTDASGGGQTLMGQSQSCGLTLPDLIFNSTGMAATGGGTKLNIQLLNTTWDKITRTFATSATQTGWNTGDTQTTSPAVGLLGLAASSTYATDSTAWPANCATSMCASSPTVSCTGGVGGTCTGMYAGSFPVSDITDDDGDGLPGITAFPSQASGYALPPTSDLFSYVADKVYIVSRNEIAITGKDMNCTTGQGTGTATITLFDNHVLGCHHTATMGALTGTAGECTTDQVQFLDDNRTIYGYDQTMGDTISKSHPVMGTVSVARLTAGATCADARGALP